MATPSQTDDRVLEFLVRDIGLREGKYCPEAFDPYIREAMQELDRATISSRSALGQSATVDVSAIQAKLDRYLAAQALCQAKKDAAAAGEDPTLVSRGAENPMARFFDMTQRRIY